MADEHKKEGKDSQTLIAKNRRAWFDYSLDHSYEGGLVLVGSEVKSLRNGKADITDAFAVVDRGEVWLKQLHIPAFPMAKAFPHEPTRAHKVLLRSREIHQIEKSLSRQGYTLVPLRLYFKKGRVKVELALAKGKKTFDKRAEIARKDAQRHTKAALGRAQKGWE